MKCPVCKDATLAMTERHGVEIDYCPSCRGVWLDRGELDKIIDQSIAQDVPEAPVHTPPQPVAQAPVHHHQPPPPPHQPYPHPGAGSYYPAYPRGSDHPYYKKKKKWWDDMFDFD